MRILRLDRSAIYQRFKPRILPPSYLPERVAKTCLSYTFFKGWGIVDIFCLIIFPMLQAFPSISSGRIQADVPQRYLHEFGRWDKGLDICLGQIVFASHRLAIPTWSGWHNPFRDLM